MTIERDPGTRIVLSWLREDLHENAERVLLRALDEVDTTPQRRSFWPARRSATMNTYARYAIAAGAVLAVAMLGYSLLPDSPSTGRQPTPVPTAVSSPSTSPTQESTFPPGTHAITPFMPGGFGMCPSAPVDPECREDPRDDSITFTFVAPETWETLEHGTWIDENAPPGGAAVTFQRGNWLYSDPCTASDAVNPTIAVGPSTDDLVTALVEHPLLDVTTPVDVALDGYSGKYLELVVPNDIGDCFRYLPMEAHIYAQGPGHRWHMWILDVGGVRVLIEGNDYAGTSAARLDEEQAIIGSIEITP